MVEKFGPEDSGSSESDSDDDDAGDGGDPGAGVVGISDAGATGGTSTGNDEEDSKSDDNPPEPGYEYYLDDHGVKKVRKIRRDDDDEEEYVPSDNEAERSKIKETVIKRKKKARKYIGTFSSAQQSVPQEPSHEAQMDPNLGFTAEEVSTMVPSPPRSAEPTPVVTPQALTRTIALTIRATTSQPAAERSQSVFERMQPDEKIDFLFSQLQAAAGQITRHMEVIKATRADSIKQQLEINTLNATVG
ncbi:hypothetical protein HanLR1_Chr09g0301011 [Helianthus annuus]|nr:hypothetical protein HanLR1_Chr09g0301011 [Helianthus annuus]